MLYGIGIDTVDLIRFKRIVEKWGRKFTSRILTQAELDYCYQHGERVTSIAVRFAAKEALYKCLPPDQQNGIGWQEAEIINEKNGCPRLIPLGKLAKMLKDRTVHISLSHSISHAIAIVIIE